MQLKVERFRPPDGLKKSPERNHLEDFVSSCEIPPRLEQIIHLKTLEDDLQKAEGDGDSILYSWANLR
ncbi:unnamed protein product [Caretta caretta]